jgi:hypothetical protein
MKALVIVGAALIGLLLQTPARVPIDLSKVGPQVGQRVPDFTLIDQVGKTRTLDSLMGPKGAMLVFYRSADW